MAESRHQRYGYNSRITGNKVYLLCVGPGIKIINDPSYLRRKNLRAATRPIPASKTVVVGSGILVNMTLSMVRVSVLLGPPHCQELSWRLSCQVAPVGLAPVMVPRLTLKVCQVLAAANALLSVVLMICEPPK